MKINGLFQNLKLKNKLIIAFMSVSIIPFLIFITISMLYISNSLNDIKKIRMEDNLTSAMNINENESEYLQKAVNDYAAWDDMYNIVDTNDSKWLEKYVTDWIPDNFNIDWILGTDTSGNVFYKYNNPNEFNTNLADKGFVLKTLEEKKISGYVSTSRGLFRIATAPIVHTDESGPVKGVWLYGVLIDENYVNKLKEIGNFDVIYYHIDGNLLATSTENLEIIPSNLKAENLELFEQVTKNLNNFYQNKKDISYVYHPLEDINHDCIGVLSVVRNTSDLRTISRQYGRISLLIISLVLIMVVYTINYFIRSIRDPLISLKDSMNIQKDSVPKKVETNLTDEIGSLANTFNNMVDKIISYRDELGKTNIKLEDKNQDYEKKISELEKFKRLTVDRELKMVELKKELKKTDKKDAK